jgi:hypothetical protein
MTFQFRRWGDLLEDIRYRFSIGGVKARHPPNRINQLHNVSWQQTRHIVSLAEDGTFLTPTSALALPTTPVITGEAYAEVDWPIPAVRVYGVRVQVTASSKWYPLKRIPFSALHDYQYASIMEGYRRQPGPMAYCGREIPKASEATEVAGKVMILPVPTSGLYRLWYMEAWQPQVEDDDLFPGHEEWHEYAIYSTLIKMLGPDADSKKMYPIWDMERKEARSQIEATAKRLQDGMAIEPRDARGDGYDPDVWGGPL